MDNDVVSVCLSSDNKYMPYAAALIDSIGDHSRSKIDIFIMNEEISDHNKSLMSSICDKYNNINVYYKIISGLDFYKDGGLFHVSALYRLMAPSLFMDLDKIMYIDLDAIVLDDISLLWSEDLKENYLAGCYDVTKKNITGTVSENYVKMGIVEADGMASYFNSGVLLMNLKKMREDGIEEKLLEFIKKYKTLSRYPDQDALNIVCKNRIKPLNIRWNYMICLYRRSRSFIEKLYGNFYSDNPAILHYLGSNKPNIFRLFLTRPLRSMVIFKKNMIFYKYLGRTPFPMLKKKWAVKL